MKSVIIFAALFAMAVGAALEPAEHAETLRYENDNIGLDHYLFDVETSDGKKHSEEGSLTNVGSETEAIAVKGAFSYTGPDGVLYTVQYIADENGFQPEGEHLPKLPEHNA